MKNQPIKCVLIMNTANGRCAEPMEFDSKNQALKYARTSFYFAYRLFDTEGNLICKGYGQNI